MKKRKSSQKHIPESLGNTVCGVRPHVFALLLNAVIHVLICVAYGIPANQLWRFVLSFFFFIYPFSFVTDVLWSMRPSVRRILTGETRINRKHYMNTARRQVESGQLLPVTISIPVYTEENAVIFETLRQSLAAVRSYRAYSSREANVLVSEDGLAPLMGGICTKESVERLVRAFHSDPKSLTPQERKAAQRILFYRENGIGFIARPAKNRAGLFKKASNLNYTLRFGDLAARGMEYAADEVEAKLFEAGYAEGDCRTHEIILLMDKDSGIREGILESVVPEFAFDEQLAYVQCATRTVNLRENYYSRATGHLTNELFQFTWPSKALQGFFVPLAGHNVMIRKSVLERSGRWSKNKVSEDFDLAIRLYAMGYHGKYAKISGLEFTEYASTHFAEETGKQRRYAYGLFEMMFDGTVKAGRTRPCDLLFMILYFFSIVNQVLLLPTVFFECYFGNIHLLWAGFLLCDACFILLPWIRGLVMGRNVPGEYRISVISTLEVAISFICHSLSILSGAVTWLLNKFRRRKRAFPSTRVGENDRGIRAGIRTVIGYIRGTWIFIPVVVLSVDRLFYVMTRHGIGTESRIAYSFIFFSLVLAPVLFTPALFGAGQKAQRQERKRISQKDGQTGRRWIMEPSIPEVMETVPEKELTEDAAAFLKGYDAYLAGEVADAEFPREITDSYAVAGCLKKEEDGRKETWSLRRLSDGLPAILRITHDYAQEDALDEAEILSRLNHPGIPRVYASFEKGGWHYLIREYIEGNTLDRIVERKGPLSEEDVFRVAQELSGILKYLHGQSPPVIHRDIKPQNIVLGRDGSIHLIDFGIARTHKTGQRQDTTVVLTLDYAPPEQYGFDQSSPLTDIYAFGVVMLYLATGQAAKPSLESEIVSNDLRSLIRKCIAFDPRDRIQSVNEIERMIRRRARKRAGKYLKVAGIAAALGIVVFAFYAAGTLTGIRNGDSLGYRTGYDQGYVDGYRNTPILSLGERPAPPKDGNLASNLLTPYGAYALEYEDNIYYVQDGDIFRMKADGTDAELFVRDGSAAGISAYNGWLYYSSESDIIQVSVYNGDGNITYGGTDGYLTVLDETYYIVTPEEVYLFDLSDWSITPVSSSLITDYARRDVPEEVLELVDVQKPAQYGYGSRGTVMLDGYDSLLWMSDPEGSIRYRVTKNRVEDFNIAGEWIFYHNLDDGGSLWCVRYDGADDHKA